MKVVVVGLGVSGRAVAKFLQQRGDIVIGIDRRRDFFEPFPILSESEPIQLRGVELVIKSPGIPYSHPWIQTACAEKIPVIGEIDVALSELSRRKKTLFGITGSNGKTTTALMAAHLLNCSGVKSLATGNIGIPLIGQIDHDVDVFIVELSSFQLERIVKNKIFDGGVVLNITPNHLDRHANFQDYVEAKMRIVTCLKDSAPLYMSKQSAPFCRGKHEIFDLYQEKVETILPLSYRGNIYPHDLQNVSAAYALTRVSEQSFKQGMETFVRPAHRLEFVRTHSGVTYINDSKATSVDAVIKAVEAIHAPILLIAGGIDKGGAFSDWLPHFRGKVLRVFALGEAARRIEEELSPVIEVEKVSSLEEGVQRASNSAKVGMTILLSPGCSSYDQFKDYMHRGETFRRIVKEKL